MDYRDYQNARDVSWQILVDAGIQELPVRIGPLCRQMGITVRLFRPEDENDGKCFLLGGHPVILVSDQVPPARQRFTAAHELGHILLGHVGKYQLVNREPNPKDNPIEQSANVFASRLLAPACVLWGCRVYSAENIAALCDISLRAASFRWERMQVLYARNKFLVSPLERQLYEQFSAFISNHRQQVSDDRA